MNISQTSRDRIVGGIFLLSVAGILLPMVFDGAGVARMTEIKVEPHAVTVSPVTPITTTGQDWAFVQEAEAVTADRPLGEPRDGERTTLGDAQTRPVEAKSPMGRELPWTVQVGSFVALASGKALNTRLLADGYHAYLTQGVGSDKRPIVRVAVGPIGNRAEAERVRDALQRRYGLAAILKKFDI